jgi:hypothetical protein
MKKIRKNSGLRRSVHYHKGVLSLAEADPDERYEVPLKQIGKGAFSKAFLTTSGTPYVYLITKEGVRGSDYSKRMLSDLTEDDEFSPYLPRVVAIGCLPSDECVYRMPFYRAPLRKGDSPDAWEQYRALQTCWEKAKDIFIYRRLSRTGSAMHDGYRMMDAVVDCAETSGLEPGLVRALRLLMDAASNYGPEYTFEFATRNLATTDNGHLILLDVVYSMRSITEKREDAQKKAQAKGRARSLFALR